MLYRRTMSSDHPHMEDFEGHVEAVASDLEYFRRKRVEPRVLFSLRRGIIGFTDLLAAHQATGGPHLVEPEDDLEARIRALEDALDAMILGIASVTTKLASTSIAIDDTRHANAATTTSSSGWQHEHTRAISSLESRRSKERSPRPTTW